MSLVDIGLNDRELLHRPLGYIDQCFDLVTSVGIESCNGSLKLASELSVIAKNEVKDVDNLL